MEVAITPRTATSQVELKISVPAQDFQEYVERAAKALTKEKALPGFRPGKAPLHVVIEALGKERVLRKAVDRALPRFFVQAVIDHHVDAISRPTITMEEVGLGTAFRFTAVVDVLPEVTLGDVKKIVAERRAVEVSDAEVERELKYLAKMRSSYLEVARPAQMGDTVIVDFNVSAHGQLTDGGESKNHPVHLGEGHFVPDFEKKLLGISAGEERTFSITFPDSLAQEALRGKQGQVWVKAHAVQKRVVPELNDDFVKSLGTFSSLSHLKEKLKKNITLEKEQKEQERFRAELSEKLAQGAVFGPLPSPLIEKEIDRRLEELGQMLGLHHKTLDDYLAQRKKTLQQMRDDMRPSAERAVKVALALKAFAAQEDIAVSDQEVEEAVQEYLQRFSSVQETQTTHDPRELRERLAGVIRNQKTLERLEELVVHA